MDELPTELLMSVFRWLSCNDLLNVLLTCKYWMNVADADHCWMLRCRCIYGCNSQCRCCGSCSDHSCKKNRQWKRHFRCVSSCLNAIKSGKVDREVASYGVLLIWSGHDMLLLQRTVYEAMRKADTIKFYTALAAYGNINIVRKFTDFSDTFMIGRAVVNLGYLYKVACSYKQARVASYFKKLWSVLFSITIIAARMNWESFRFRVFEKHGNDGFSKLNSQGKAAYRDFVYYICLAKMPATLSLLLNSGLSPNYIGFHNSAHPYGIVAYCCECYSYHCACLLLKYGATVPDSYKQQLINGRKRQLNHRHSYVPKYKRACLYERHTPS